MPTASRGDMWIVDLGLVGKVRPCLVLSVPAGLKDRALVTLVAHTTSVRGSNVEVAVRTKFLSAGVFDAQNMLTVPEAKLIRKLGSLPPDQLSLVEQGVRRWLGLWGLVRCSSHPFGNCSRAFHSGAQSRRPRERSREASWSRSCSMSGRFFAAQSSASSVASRGSWYSLANGSGVNGSGPWMASSTTARIRRPLRNRIRYFGAVKAV